VSAVAGSVMGDGAFREAGVEAARLAEIEAKLAVFAQEHLWAEDGSLADFSGVAPSATPSSSRPGTRDPQVEGGGIGKWLEQAGKVGPSGPNKGPNRLNEGPNRPNKGPNKTCQEDNEGPNKGPNEGPDEGPNKGPNRLNEGPNKGPNEGPDEGPNKTCQEDTEGPNGLDEAPNGPNEGPVEGSVGLETVRSAKSKAKGEGGRGLLTAAAAEALAGLGIGDQYLAEMREANAVGSICIYYYVYTT
jgi:hypothetical protein